MKKIRDKRMSTFENHDVKRRMTGKTRVISDTQLNKDETMLDIVCTLGSDMKNNLDDDERK